MGGGLPSVLGISTKVRMPCMSACETHGTVFKFTLDLQKQPDLTPEVNQLLFYGQYFVCRTKAYMLLSKCLIETTA
jgi:hypothetical protein